VSSDNSPRRYLRPLGLLDGAAALVARQQGWALPLAGGPAAFTHAILIERPPGGDPDPEARLLTLAAPALRQLAQAEPEWGELLDRLTAPRPDWAGLALDRPRVMGVINVTPDSFSDPGQFAGAEAATAAGRAMAAAGADILDLGGESTRPGAEPVPPAVEQERVLPVVRALSGSPARISIDSRNAATMAAALDAGAALVNDISALAHDPAALPLVAARGCPVVLMHMRGEPRSMQQQALYRDVVLDVFDALAERIAACEEAGVARARIAVDPGIGFGKTHAHNLALVEGLALLHGLGCPLVIGVSRKGFIGRYGHEPEPRRRLPGSLAVGLAAVARGAQLLRVHDVAETVQALRLWRAVQRGEG